jgi:hypothetical protein
MSRFLPIRISIDVIGIINKYLLPFDIKNKKKIYLNELCKNTDMLRYQCDDWTDSDDQNLVITDSLCGYFFEHKIWRLVILKADYT